MSISDTTIDEGDVADGRWMSREKLAWSVMLVAFAVFMVLLISVPLGGHWYLQHATVAQLATVQGTSGKTLIEDGGTRANPVAIEAGRAQPDVREGSVLRADDSQAVIFFWDRSSLTVFPNTTVTINEMRRPRFGYSDQPSRIALTVHNGRVRAQVSPRAGRAMEWVVNTPQALAPHGGILLEPGSYAIEAMPDLTHVSVRSGAAQVSGQTGKTVRLREAERAEIALGAEAVGPLAANRNLLVNSDFQNPEHASPISQGDLVSGWQVWSDQGGDGGDVDGTAEVVTLGTTRAVHLVRSGSNNNHGETGIVQEVNKLVEDYLSLLLRFDVRLVHQSLSGGGEQSSEFPLIVRVDYTDQNGDLQHWIHGFYYQNESGYNIINGEEIPRDVPFRFEVNLEKVLNNPRTIERVQFYASGWDWNVYVSEVELVVE